MKRKTIAILLLTALILTCTACEKDAEKSEKPDKPTAAPVQFQEEEILPLKTAEDKRALNIFLSNFSEAYYLKGSDPISGDEGKIDFAYTHLMINAPSRITGGAISAAEVDEVLEKYFGESIPHKTPADSRMWEYKDGKFVAFIPGGDSYGDFSIATSMKTMKDGNFTVSFNIYQLPDVSGGDIVTDTAAYSLSDAEAAAKYEKQADGTAILKAKEYKGKQTYELVSYEVNYLV